MEKNNAESTAVDATVEIVEDSKEVIIPVPGAKVPQLASQDSFLATIERLAALPDVNPEHIEQFIKMNERVLDRQAQKAFNAAMTRAQKKIELVVATSWNEQTKSHYANLKTTLLEVKPIYTQEGFSLMFYEGDSSRVETHKRVCVDIIHNQGHTEKRHGEFAIQTTGIAGKTMMTQIHGEGSAFSYGRRYLTCMIFNVPTGDDDDGQAAGGKIVEFVDEKQLSELVDTINDLEADEPKYLEFISKVFGREIKELAQIPAIHFKKAIEILEKRKKPE